MKKNKQTPVMKQFWGIKDKNPNSIVLFRMGDFYETFEKDALITSNVLGIALTKRSNGAASSVALAGFPYHSLDQHLHKLLKAGHRVAICEQVENPKDSKGIVKRDVVEVISPGTAISDKFLDRDKNNYLCSVFHNGKKIGFSLLDHSTGDFLTTEIESDDYKNLISKFDITEILIVESQKNIFSKFNIQNEIVINYIPEWVSEYEYNFEILCNHFGVKDLKGFGVKPKSCSIISTGIILHYIKENFKDKSNHINHIRNLKYRDKMDLDYFTIRNLELFNPLTGNNKKATFLHSINKTISASGGRLIKNWISTPLSNIKAIKERQNIVDEYYKNPDFLDSTRVMLKKTFDIERITARISAKKSNPVELINLASTLKEIKNYCELVSTKNKRISKLINKIKDNKNIIKKICSTIINNPPVNLNKGNFINKGLSKELDDLRLISFDANKWMLEYQQKLRLQTSISSLKIAYNKVFGYYIDVTKVHSDKVPDYFIKKQTLVNNERFFTEDLKIFEDKILNADQKIAEIENKIYYELCEYIVTKSTDIQNTANIISHIDIYSSFAHLAVEKKYVKPKVSKDFSLKIKDGRHPVIENLIDDEFNFISNNTTFTKNKFLSIITGPNMAGKSTYLRQTGLIVIMAQIGSFVPASYAEIGVVDKLFTRVGASDNLYEGESTFLVEMHETANIINNSTKSSLILLDEIGRGTSTYDGLSIAWAVTEYIHNKIGAKTLFATHYHELVELADSLNNANNLNILVQESDDKSNIIFLRKIIEGGTDKSYGIYVAKMAGIPEEILNKSKIHLEILKQKQKKLNINDENLIKSIISKISKDNQQSSHILETKLKQIDINNISPLEALNILSHLIKKYAK